MTQRETIRSYALNMVAPVTKLDELSDFMSEDTRQRYITLRLSFQHFVDGMRADIIAEQAVMSDPERTQEFEQMQDGNEG